MDDSALDESSLNKSVMRRILSLGILLLGTLLLGPVSPDVPFFDSGTGGLWSTVAFAQPADDSGDSAEDDPVGAGTSQPAAAAASDDEGILAFFAESGPMAKIVLGILILFSLASWAIIFRKAVQLRRSHRQSEKFLHAFRKSARFSEVGNAATRLEGSPLVGVFRAGYAEIDAQIRSAREGARDRGDTSGDYRMRSLAALERSLQRAIHGEVAVLGRGTPFLATTAAATPFIGLFGTVWGIMVAFGDIGATGSTSIVTVAPGIAEALVNTAAGLAAAIPALIAYNHFAQRLRGIKGRLEDFALELLSLAERNFT